MSREGTDVLVTCPPVDASMAAFGALRLVVFEILKNSDALAISEISQTFFLNFYDVCAATTLIFACEIEVSSSS